ncbi:MAG: hypothetical protein B7733_06100 [Myxococcales bacterium FL481]|nr:MAG: hypothetical protein B7733_06100 [Myxococcales bacterium FL481]
MARSERVDDLDFCDMTPAGPPTEEGQVRLVNGDLVAFVGGQVRSLTQGGGALPPAALVGEVLFSCDGATFEVALPVTSCFGWLVNDDGIHIVNG